MPVTIWSDNSVTNSGFAGPLSKSGLISGYKACLSVFLGGVLALDGGELPSEKEQVNASELAFNAVGSALSPALPVRTALALNAFVMEPNTLGLGVGVHNVTYRGVGTLTYTPGQVMYGLVDGLDIRLFANGLQQMRTVDGFRDRGGSEPWLGLHGRCLARGKLNVSVGYWHKFPVPNIARGMGNDRHEDQLLVLVSHPQSAWLMDFNAILNHVPVLDGGRKLQAGAAFSLTRAFGQKLNVSAGFIRLEPRNGISGVFNSHVSFGWLVNPELMVDMGMEHGLNRENKTKAITLGFAYYFGKLDF